MVYVLLPYTPFEPVGGVQTAFDYVQRLNTLAGKKIAAVLADSSFVASWLPKAYKDVPVLPTTTKLKVSDTLILPEVSIEMAKDYPQVARKLLMVLNWKYFEDNLKSYSLRKLGYTGIITNSQYSLERILPHAAGLPVWHVPHVIDTDRFRSIKPVEKRARHSILILNRKNTHHIPAVLEFLKGFSHTVTLLNNVAPDKMPEQFVRHQIFINLGYPEGFCRPAAEAMASGCIVVGFTGGGASDFMVHGVNSQVAEDGDEADLIQQLNTALHMTDRQKRAMSKRARSAILSTYAPANQAKVLAQVFAVELEKRFTLREISRLFGSNRVLRPVHPKNVVRSPAKTIAVLEYQLYQERIQRQSITNSKFFKAWQVYCSLREKLQRGLVARNLHSQA